MIACKVQLFVTALNKNKKMDISQIEYFVTRYTDYGYSLFNVSVVHENDLIGVFVKGKDFNNLKENNCWRLLRIEHIGFWNKTRDLKFTEIVTGRYIRSIDLLKIITPGVS